MESLPFRKLALTVEYDGAAYSGFQLQADGPTVQGRIERALENLTGERIKIVSAGRTDAGVHARGQVVCFFTRSTLSDQTFVGALNHYLRPDIAVKAVSEVDGVFDARRDATSRVYRYRIVNSATPSPVERGYAHFVPLALDVDAMNSACQCLVGRHDFASFTGPTDRSTVREVYRAEVWRDGEMVLFEIAANSFLHKQVRSMVGALVRIGLGRLGLSEFQEIMNARRPGSMGPVAPARGLCLMRVEYPQNKFVKGS
jgi:tRNA pseudouridine38-40 synthase